MNWERLGRLIGLSSGTAKSDVVTLAMGNPFGGSDIEVDREAGTIKNVSVATRGPTDGHGFDVDEVMLKQALDGINSPGGMRVCVTHPLAPDPFSPPADDMPTLVGQITNGRIAGDKLKGDVKLGAYAKSNPAGDYWTWLMDLADEPFAQAQIGMSLRFVPAPFEQRQGPGGEGLAPAGRIQRMLAVDFVGKPGANPSGLLSSAGPRHPVKGGFSMDPALKAYLVQCGLKADASDEEATTFMSTLKDEQKTVSDALAAKATASAEGSGDTPPAAGQGAATAQPAAGTAAPEPVAAGVATGAAQPQDASAVAAEAATAAATAAIAAERKRGTELRGIAQTVGLDAETVQTWIEKGLTPDQARQEALAAVSKGARPLALGAPGSATRISVGADLGRESFAPAMSDAILLRAGRPLVELDSMTGLAARETDGRMTARKPHDRANEFRGMSLVDMGRAWLSAAGVPDVYNLSKTRVADLVMDLQTLGRTYGADVVGLAQSTSDFPYILDDAMGKSLRTAYGEAPSTWQAWVRRTTAPDFKDIKRVALSESPDLVSITEGGGINYVTMGEGREVYALVEYNGGIVLTRRAFIDDDMDAFSRIPVLQANAATRKEDDVNYAVLTGNAAMADGTALFHSGHSNLASSSAVPSTASFNAMRTGMRTQTGPKGAILNLMPKHLIVPANLEGTVRQIIVSETDPSASSSGITNTWKGELNLVVEPRLDATVDSDTDKATWYGAADYNQIDTIEMCFLEDEQVPQLRSEQEFDSGDRKFAVRHTMAAKAIDHRGVWKNKGD